jgi:integrase
MNNLEEFLQSRPWAKLTIERYRRVVSEYLHDHKRPGNIKPATLLEWINRPEWGNAQQRMALQAVKNYIKWKYGESHPALLAKIKVTKGKAQRSLNREQALALLASFDPSTPKGARDLAIAALAIDTGLRLAELCRLKLADVDLSKTELQVIIKGGDYGRARFSPETANLINTWLYYRSKKSQAETLFTNSRTGKPLTREGLQTIVKKWGKDLGIKLSPHDLRRTFATLATLNGAPNRIVQVAGRWKTADMVERYTQNIEQDAISDYLPISRL